MMPASPTIVLALVPAFLLQLYLPANVEKQHMVAHELGPFLPTSKTQMEFLVPDVGLN